MMDNYLLLCLFGISSCFISSTVAREAIIGGSQANDIDQLAYSVSVQVHGHGYVCGGGIIGDAFILTAAHCILNRERKFFNPHISVHAGTTNYYNTKPPAVTVKVEKVFFPSEFDPTVKNTTGDIAVLMVESLGFAYSTHLKRLKLPLDDHYGTIAKIAGFGWYHRTIQRKMVGDTDGQLRYALASVLSNRECEIYNRNRAIRTDKQLCARIMPSTNNESSSTCTGDAGGPLVHDGIVIGVLSKVPHHCDEQRFPAIYTQVAHYRRMIVSAMQDSNAPGIISIPAFHKI